MTERNYKKEFSRFSRRDTQLMASFLLGAGANINTPGYVRSYLVMSVGVYKDLAPRGYVLKWLLDPALNTSAGRKAFKSWLTEGRIEFTYSQFRECCGSNVIYLRDTTQVENNIRNGSAFDTTSLRSRAGGIEYKTPFNNMTWLMIPQRFMDYMAPTLLTEGWTLVAESSSLEMGTAIFLRDTVDTKSKPYIAALQTKRRPIPKTMPKKGKSRPAYVETAGASTVHQCFNFSGNKIGNLDYPDRNVEFQLVILRDHGTGTQITDNFQSAMENDWELAWPEKETMFNGRYLPAAHFLMPLIRRNPNFDPMVDR